MKSLSFPFPYGEPGNGARTCMLAVYLLVRWASLSMHFPKFTKCVFMLQPDDHRCYHVMSKPVMDSLLSHFVPSSTKVNLCWSEHTGMAGLINCVVRYCTKTLSQPHTQGFSPHC